MFNEKVICMCPKKYATYVTLLVFVHRTAGLVGIKTGFWSFFPPPVAARALGIKMCFGHLSGLVVQVCTSARVLLRTS